MNLSTVNDSRGARPASALPFSPAPSQRQARSSTEPARGALVDYVVSGSPAPAPAPAASHDPVSLHQGLLETMREIYPDIRRAAADAIEQRLQRDYGVQLDADQAYFNTFTSYHVEQPTRAHPLSSLSLTDLLLTKDTIDLDALPLADEMSGIFSEGRWTRDFSSTNKIALRPSQVLTSVAEDDFFNGYRDQLRSYWDDHFDTLQLLAELQVEAYVQEHRSEGNRAQALGLSPELGLSEHALGMVAEALGRPFPDQPPLGTKTMLLDINGYPAEDIVWLCDTQRTRCVLYLPGDARALREYPDLASMRADIRDMTRHPEGRAALARHFSAYHRSNGFWRNGVDRWLADLGKSSGEYDYAIAYYGSNAAAGQLHLPAPSASARELLSNKAVAMLSEAAGFPDPGLGTYSTQSYLLDINGVPAIDIIWMKAADGHIVLLLPDDDRPVREYANLDAMRRDIARIIAAPASARELAHHFSVADRRCTSTYDGVDEWMRKIRDDDQRYLKHIAFDGARNRLADVSIFHRQAARRRANDLAQAARLAAQAWTSASERQQWLNSFEAARQPFAGGHPLKRACAAEIGPMPEREQRSDNDAVTLCLNMHSRPMRWGQSLGQRLVQANARMQASTASAGSAGAARSHVLQLGLPTDRPSNTRGFLGRTDLGQLYAVVAEPGGVPTHEHARAAAMDGELVYTFYLNEDAARRMAILRWGPLLGLRYPLYRLDARNLETVSFGDNRANNPDYARLVAGRESDFLTDLPLASPAARANARTLLESAVQVKFTTTENARQRLALARHAGGGSTCPGGAG